MGEGRPKGWRLLQSLERHGSPGLPSDVCLLTSMNHSTGTVSVPLQFLVSQPAVLELLEKGSQWTWFQEMLKIKVPGQVTAEGQTNLSLSRSRVELNLA